jgi:hypothetical protein
MSAVTFELRLKGSRHRYAVFHHGYYVGSMEQLMTDAGFKVAKRWSFIGRDVHPVVNAYGYHPRSSTVDVGATLAEAQVRVRDIVTEANDCPLATCVDRILK